MDKEKLLKEIQSLDIENHYIMHYKNFTILKCFFDGRYRLISLKEYVEELFNNAEEVIFFLEENNYL